MTLFEAEDGATPLSADERSGLKLADITFRHELNQAEYENITRGEAWAWQWLHKDILSEDFLRRLHKKMFGDVWAWAGSYSRESKRRIGLDRHEIPLAIHDLLADTASLCRYRAMLPDEIALRLHWRLTHIHPFPNGNGRHARLMADLLIKKLGQERFTWGVAGERDGLWAASDSRRRYIAALQAADCQDIALLLAFARS